MLPVARFCFLRASKGVVIPNPVGDERVILASHLLHGMALPPSEFFCEVLDYYGLQPHNIVPSSVLVLAGFQALFEGYLGLRPRLDFFRYCFRVCGRTLSGGHRLALGGSVEFVCHVHSRFVYPVMPCSDVAMPWMNKFF